MAIFRATWTRPLPPGAELFTRNGTRFARWIDGKGRKQTAKVTTGKDGSPRIVRECRKLMARYRNGAGRLVTTPTGCRTTDAAETILTELHIRADKVKAGYRTAAEDCVLDWQAEPVAASVVDYLEHLRGKRGKGAKPTVSRMHVANVDHCLNEIVVACGFAKLRDLNRPAVERWVNKAEAAGMGARTLNLRMAALSAFGNWLIEKNRIVANPFVRLPKRDEKTNPRRARRAMTGTELTKLLRVARLRSLAEYGREVIGRDAADKPTDKRSRRTWTKAPLAYDDLDAAVERARVALRKRPEFIAELERQGRERQLIYKTLVLTGLRKGELASLTVGNVELDGKMPYLRLAAADEKAGRGADIPLRPDLAADVRGWLAEQLDLRQAAARRTLKPLPIKLPPDTPLFNVPDGLVRIFDRDLVAAGIARIVIGDDGKPFIEKRDERGRTVDIHALRHTFGTHLSKGGIAPRTAMAAMRHSTLELTMQTYTDPKLLDVAGALDVLPDLPLDDNRHAAKANGTDGALLASTLALASGNPCTNTAIAVHTSENQAAAGIAVTSDSGISKDDVTNNVLKRATGFEPATFSLEG